MTHEFALGKSYFFFFALWAFCFWHYTPSSASIAVAVLFRLPLDSLAVNSFHANTGHLLKLHECPDLHVEDIECAVSSMRFLQATCRSMLGQRSVGIRSAWSCGTGRQRPAQPYSEMATASKGHEIDRDALEHAVTATPFPSSKPLRLGPGREKKAIAVAVKVGLRFWSPSLGSERSKHVLLTIAYQE
jgi:hypothetical protein